MHDERVRACALCLSSVVFIVSEREHLAVNPVQVSLCFLRLKAVCLFRVAISLRGARLVRRASTVDCPHQSHPLCPTSFQRLMMASLSIVIATVCRGPELEGGASV